MERAGRCHAIPESLESGRLDAAAAMRGQGGGRRDVAEENGTS